VAGGKAAHEHVERRFAAPIDLLLPVIVVGDAAPPRGHDPDRAAREYQILQRLDDAHRAQRVGDHDAHKLVGRDIGDRFTAVVGDTGIDEQHVELSRCQMRSQPGHLIWMVDVDGLDFEPPVGSPQRMA
jgi:hypothetical protein